MFQGFIFLKIDEYVLDIIFHKATKMAASKSVTVY